MTPSYKTLSSAGQKYDHASVKVAAQKVTSASTSGIHHERSLINSMPLSALISTWGLFAAVWFPKPTVFSPSGEPS